MTTQPEALRLAKLILERPHDALDFLPTKAAAELRRLHQSEREGWRYADELEQERKRLAALNQELVEALKAADWYIGQLEPFVYGPDDDGVHEEHAKVRAAIAKAEKEEHTHNFYSTIPNS